MVESGRLTPALVSPEATAIGKHAGEVADSDDARPGKGGAGVSVGPGGAAVGGPEDEVVVVVGKATAVFVHAGDVDVARGQVTGDLDIADEGSAVAHCYRGAPSHTVVSRAANEEAAAPDTEVVPGNVHPPIEGATRVVVGPARLAVVLAGGVNAIMGPARRIRRIGGLVTAEALSATARVEPGGEPGRGGAVVQNDGVAKGTGERALAAAVGDTGEGGSAVTGDRYTGEIAGGGASRIVVGDDHLVGVIWISRSVGLRLDSARRGLGAGDQVDVRAAKGQGRQRILDNVGNIEGRGS